MKAVIAGHEPTGAQSHFACTNKRAALFRAVVERFAAAHRRRKAREILSSLDDHILLDIGIDPAQARYPTKALLDSLTERN